MDRFKCVPMERFVVCVGRIFCGGKDRDIVSFLTEIWINRRRYVHW